MRYSTTDCKVETNGEGRRRDEKGKKAKETEKKEGENKRGKKANGRKGSGKGK